MNKWIFFLLIMVGLLWLFLSSYLNVWKVLLGLLFVGMGIAGLVMNLSNAKKQ